MSSGGYVGYQIIRSFPLPRRCGMRIFNILFAGYEHL